MDMIKNSTRLKREEGISNQRYVLYISIQTTFYTTPKLHNSFHKFILQITLIVINPPKFCLTLHKPNIHI